MSWPLVLGAAILAVVAVVAVAGPWIAPRSPLERVAVVRTPDGPVGPPFPLLTPGFPLGSDRFGRDLLSRLLWAVQPTMIMVLTVAAARLVAGITIGMAAGWSGGALGRALDALMAAALAVPTLIVALAVIAVVGIERGLPAFVLGMALTGWVETARVVSEVTRSLRRQPFTQAAHALGAPAAFILVRHVTRHVAPLVASLLALEIAGTLMLAVSLGFLGYYIGGGVWVVMDGDAIPVAQRATEYPELGQMLATSLDRLLDPRPMVIVGATIFVAILGFNLLGEGLRRRAERPGAQPSPLRPALLPLEEAIAAAALGRVPRPAAAAGGIVLAGLVGWLALAQARAAPPPAAPVAAPLAPSGQLWAAERGDAQGTLATPPMSGAAPAILWAAELDGGLSGGPAVAADGTVYLAAAEGALVALGPDGAERWRAALPAPPFGGPAVAADGTVYVVDSAAGLSAYAPGGELRWRFQSTARREGTSGPVVGPDGTVYYTLVDRVQAVAPDGAPRWVSAVADDYLEVAPRLSPSGDTVFLKELALSAADGSQLDVALGGDDAEFSDPTFFVGADGGTYFRYGHTAVEWRRAGSSAEVVREVSWDAARATTFFPADAGATGARTVWMLYSTPVADTRLIWIGADGELAGNLFFPQRSSRVIGVAPDGTVYLCGRRRGGRLECGAFAPAARQALWVVPLNTGAGIVGGAVAGDRLYLATEDGLFAIGAAEAAAGAGEG